MDNHQIEEDDTRSKSQTPAYRHERGDSFGSPSNHDQKDRSSSQDIAAPNASTAEFNIKAQQIDDDSGDNLEESPQKIQSDNKQRYKSPSSKSLTKSATIQNTIQRLYNPNPFRGYYGLDSSTNKKNSRSFVNTSNEQHYLPDFGDSSSRNNNNTNSVSPNNVRHHQQYTERRVVTQNDSYDQSFSYTERSKTPPSRKLMFDFGKESRPPAPSSTRTQVSQNIVHEWMDRKRKAEESKKQGAQRLENRFIRLEMERQCKMLENRVKRIQVEHQLMESRIKKGQTMVNKTVQAKKRHFDDLVQAENHKSQKDKELQLLKQKIAKEKADRKLKKEQQQQQALAQKRQSAKQMKSNLRQQLMDKDVEVIKEQTEKHWKYRAIADHEKSTREMRKTFQKQHENDMDVSFNHLVEQEQQRKKLLEDQINQLAQYEGNLIEQFKTTQQSMMEVTDKMKRISSVKVGLDQPVVEEFTEPGLMNQL